MVAALLSALLSPGCTSLDLQDCEQFGDCERYVPRGLACGLAHGAGDHAGGSCQLEWDPARQGDLSGVRDAGEHDTPCPDPGDLRGSAYTGGYEPAGLGDTESSGEWHTCASRGNLAGSSGRLDEVPSGAVCALGKPEEGELAWCEGALPERGECPAGFRFRWFPDVAFNGPDDECVAGLGVEEGDLSMVVLPTTFCEVAPDHGCSEGECPPQIPIPGTLCGLHTRPSTGLAPEDEAVDDLRTWYELGVDKCVPYRDHLLDLQPALEAALDLEPQCMGVPVREGCPEGLDLVCTVEYAEEDEEPGLPVTTRSVCWCDDAGSRQALSGERADGADDAGGPSSAARVSKP